MSGITTQGHYTIPTERALAIVELLDAKVDEWSANGTYKKVLSEYEEQAFAGKEMYEDFTPREWDKLELFLNTH